VWLAVSGGDEFQSREAEAPPKTARSVTKFSHST
jgi:hypothetical protein